MGFVSVSRTHVGRRRKINEDALLSRPDLGLWAVADGMGGHDAGEVASALIIERLDACPIGLDRPALVAAAKGALQDVNARLRALGAAGESRRTIGSTVVALAADAAGFSCLWVGDSRAYLAHGGALRQLSRDHSLVQELVDAGEIAPADAGAHPNANIITRAVGAAAALSIDTVEGEVAPGDVFLLASDGVTRLVDEAELLAALASDDLDAAADRLVETCLERGAPDNLTLVIVRAA